MGVSSDVQPMVSTNPTSGWFRSRECHDGTFVIEVPVLQSTS
ncbi:hypothetical protein ARZXY2_4371 (plasmid) [Arthrobacter sp. ZXY-2]|nr:hypothetical protein ARZXY2_4371 [Arthrobacter sp. ZXY-2]